MYTKLATELTPASDISNFKSHSMEKPKILLVEDDPNFGNVLKNYLELNDYDVTLCRDGVEGKESFMNNNYDLCILDVMMPKKDGFMLAEEIRLNNKDVPLIFL